MTADRRASGSAGAIRVLMLGHGWFPDELGGLDRYYRELLQQLPEARGLVIGPGSDAPARVGVVSSHDAPLRKRLLALARRARELAPHVDVVDAHFAPYSFVALLLSGLRGKPLLVHFHGPWADENVAAGDTAAWRRYARRRLERSVYRRAALTVTLTGAFRRTLVERYGVSPWRIAVVAPGVDPQIFSPGDRASARRGLGVADAEFVVCCARRLVPRMGIATLLEAWARGPGLQQDAKLLIAGDGPQRDELRRQIAARGLGPSVLLLGRISDEELVSVYRAADVNVVPSVALEGFGLTVLEAAACGTPSIVTDVGGLPEAVGGLPELVIPAADIDALTARLDRARAGVLPARSSTRAWAERRAWPRVAERHRELLAQVIRDGDPERTRRRVVYVDHVAKLSGGELALLHLLEALDEVDAHVILAEDGPFVDRLQQAGISVEVLAMPDRTRELRKDMVRVRSVPLAAVADTALYALRLAVRLRRLRPDLVHTNSLKAGVYGSLAARLAGVPAVWHLRDRLAPDYLPLPAIILMRLLTQWLPRIVISNSKATRRTLRRRGRFLVISSPVIGEALGFRGSPAMGGSEDRPLVVAIVGRLTPWKGQDVFLRAFARAFLAGPQRAAIIGAPMFGDAEIVYADGLRALAAELGIAERVEFRGHRDDMLAELRSVDVLVHASLIPEPFGQVVLEGMAACRPVVATRQGGPGEIITDGVDGLLYTAGDDAELARILTRLDSDTDLRRRMGHNGSERAKDFAPVVIAKQMMDAYDVALSRRGSP
jgi:glycosyltransferase involved in cell wall biosynthesis